MWDVFQVSILLPLATSYPSQIPAFSLDVSFVGTSSLTSLDWLSAPALTLQQTPVGPLSWHLPKCPVTACFIMCVESNPRTTAGVDFSRLGWSCLHSHTKGSGNTVVRRKKGQINRTVEWRSPQGFTSAFAIPLTWISNSSMGLPRSRL